MKILFNHLDRRLESDADDVYCIAEAALSERRKRGEETVRGQGRKTGWFFYSSYFIYPLETLMGIVVFVDSQMQNVGPNSTNNRSSVKGGKETRQYEDQVSPLTYIHVGVVGGVVCRFCGLMKRKCYGKLLN